MQNKQKKRVLELLAKLIVVTDV